MELREFEPDDWKQVWPIVEDIVRRGDTFCYDPNLTETEGREIWLTPKPGRVVVAVENGEVLGTSNMYENQQGPGSHIASGNFMVSSNARRKGVGFALGQDLITWARHNSFDGVQFNAVAGSNTPAVKMYLRLGFQIMGTVPGAFRHPEQGRVGLHFMYFAINDVP